MTYSGRMRCFKQIARTVNIDPDRILSRTGRRVNHRVDSLQSKAKLRRDCEIGAHCGNLAGLRTPAHDAQPHAVRNQLRHKPAAQHSFAASQQDLLWHYCRLARYLVTESGIATPSRSNSSGTGGSVVVWNG